MSVAEPLLLYRYRLPALTFKASRSSGALLALAFHEPRCVTTKSLQGSPEIGVSAARLAVSGPPAGSVPEGKKTRFPDESVPTRSGAPPPVTIEPGTNVVPGFHGT